MSSVTGVVWDLMSGLHWVLAPFGIEDIHSVVWSVLAYSRRCFKPSTFAPINSATGELKFLAFTAKIRN